MKPVYFVLSVLILLTACHKPAVKKNEINKIEIATGGCLRSCPVLGIIIDSTLTYQYYGGYKAKPQGYYKGKVSPAFWDTLNVKLKQINFQKLDTSNIFPIDGESAEAVLYWGNQKRHTFKLFDENSDNVERVFRWILNSYKYVELSKSTDSVKFETTYQHMEPPSPPNPKTDYVKFPPPAKHRKR